MIRIIFLIFCCVSFLASEEACLAEEPSDSSSRASISTGIDIVSRYIWRGLDFGQSPSIQPSLSVSWNRFTLGSWGAYKVTGSGDQETDFYISSYFGPVTFELWDYWSFNDTIQSDFFDYSNETDHQLEFQAKITGGDKFPFGITAGYFFYGSDKSNSLYLELQYFRSIGKYDLTAFSGYQARGDYYAEKASFISVGCTLERNLDIVHAEIPISLSLIINPDSGYAYLIAGISL